VDKGTFPPKATNQTKLEEVEAASIEQAADFVRARYHNDYDIQDHIALPDALRRFRELAFVATNKLRPDRVLVLIIDEHEKIDVPHWSVIESEVALNLSTKRINQTLRTYRRIPWKTSWWKRHPKTAWSGLVAFIAIAASASTTVTNFENIFNKPSSPSVHQPKLTPLPPPPTVNTQTVKPPTQTPVTPPPPPPSPIPSQSHKAALFIQPSDDGVSQQIANDLENLGIRVVPDETGDGLTLQIEDSVVEGLHYDNSNSKLVWSAVAKAHVLMRDQKNSVLLANQPFNATTNPPTNSSDTAIAAAKQQLAAKISDYLYQNRVRFNFQN
jgi:hypothetical protein